MFAGENGLPGQDMNSGTIAIGFQVPPSALLMPSQATPHGKAATVMIATGKKRRQR